MHPEDEIKQFAMQRGALAVGIAAVEDINRFAPPGHRPDDFLKDAKSVIVLSGQQTTHGAWRSQHTEPMSFAADFFRIRVGITLPTAKYIENQFGYYALPDVPGIVGWNGSLSFKLCAEMAGLGTRAMAGGVILNRELGLLNIAVVITTMPLVNDKPLSTPVCPSESCIKMWEKRHITPCLETCTECLSGEIEGNRIKWMRYDRRICTTRSTYMHPASYLRMYDNIIHEVDPQLRKFYLFGQFSRSITQVIATGSLFGQCGECFRYCPICVTARKLVPKDAGINSH